MSNDEDARVNVGPWLHLANRSDTFFTSRRIAPLSQPSVAIAAEIDDLVGIFAQKV